MKLYYFLGTLASPFASIALLLFSWITRTPRARVVVQNENGQVLFVQNLFSRGKWSLPGGGIHRGEDPGLAGAREVKEETGVELADARLVRAGTLRAAGHQEIIFTTNVSGEVSLPIVSPSKFEIQGIAWFLPREVPAIDPLSQRVLDTLEM